MLRRPLAPLALVLLAASLASASGPGYHDSGSLESSGVLLHHDARYLVTVAAGDVLEATLTFDPAQGSAYMGAYPPGTASPFCAVLDVDCHTHDLEGFLEDVSNNPLCGWFVYSGSSLSGSPQKAIVVATAPGDVEIEVIGGIIPERLDYELMVSVNGGVPFSVTRLPDQRYSVSGDYGLLCAGA